jgi:hypothetical protein
MGERQEVREFENNHLFLEFPDLYKYDYPDTGKRAYKQKPPDSFYIYGKGFLIEYKMPGKTPEEHQIEELLKAHYAGALSFVATIYPDKSIVFASILSDKTYELKFNGYKYKNLSKLFDNLIEVYK